MELQLQNLPHNFQSFKLSKAHFNLSEAVVAVFVFLFQLGVVTLGLENSQIIYIWLD